MATREATPPPDWNAEENIIKADHRAIPTPAYGVDEECIEGIEYLVHSTALGNRVVPEQ
jgi:hypothetical protein